MQYCIQLMQREFEYIDEIDQITIQYRRTDTSLLDFLLLHKNQRVNILISDIKDFIENNCVDIFLEIKEKYPELNFVFEIDRSYYNEEAKELREILKDMPCFYRHYINDWDSFHAIIALNPSDVYITEALGFELKTINEFTKPLGISVRVFANVAQSSSPWTPALKRFFIRPDDVELYEPYVDCIDFFGERANKETAATHYKIYAKDKKWFGKLNELILSFNADTDSRYLIPHFAERRLNCGKKCLKGKRCGACDTIGRLADVMEKIDSDNE